MRRPLAAAGLTAALVLVLPGCGGGGNPTSTESTTTTTTAAPSARTTAFRVYFLRKRQVWPVARAVEKTKAVAAAALDALLEGPTKGESTSLKLATSIPEGTTVKSLSVSEGAATLELSTELSAEPMSQVVYTLTQFPTVTSVEIAGKRYTRADFEAQTPPILVESPLSFQHASSPFRATGTANTFEATFQYEVTDTDGKIVDSHVVTATSGSGTRGTFDFTTKPFKVPFNGIGELIVFELSAKDGSRIHLREIPVRMTRAARDP